MDDQVIVVVIEPARDDLRAIVAFIDQDSRERALIFRGRLLTEAERTVDVLRFWHDARGTRRV